MYGMYVPSPAQHKYLIPEGGELVVIGFINTYYSLFYGDVAVRERHLSHLESKLFHGFELVALQTLLCPAATSQVLI